MTFVPWSEVLLGVLFLFFLQGCCSRSHTCGSPDCDVNISCLIINLEYLDCNWTKPQMQEINYTFSSVFRIDNSYQECQQYLQENGQNVGCRIPLQNQVLRFDPFYIKLSSGRNQSTFKNYTDLRKRVKLNPPNNVSLNLNGVDGEICLHWVNSAKVTQQCVVSMVRHQRGSEEWKINKESSSPYCITPFSDGVTYTFQVRSTIADYCARSSFWSDWSDPVQWSNGTSTNWGQQPQPWYNVVYGVVAFLLLILLSVLLYNCDRKKIILIPAVPDPSKRLQDLFQKYNGNVESWVHISRELKEAFEPDYTESYCVVCEPSPAVESKSADGPTEQS